MIKRSTIWLMFPLLVGALAFSSAHAQAQESAAEYGFNQFQTHANGKPLTYLETERLEFRTNEGDPIFLWDAQGWYGGDLNKLWLKTEGEYDFDASSFEEAEIQALWSRSITKYFDLQAGIRHDLAPGDDRSFVVIGAQGLTPYLFEIDTALFISDDGDISARIEAEYELMITQRIILQPRMEFNFEFQDVPAYGLGGGLSTIEAGGRLRYEIIRQFAPYIGVSWERAVGTTADFIRTAGGDPSSVSAVIGFRTWF